jgi:hypothetical protein
MAPEFAAKEWGVVGEFVTGGDAPSILVPPRPIYPAPDWAEEERERLERERAARPEPPVEEEPRPFPPPAREAAS